MFQNKLYRLEDLDYPRQELGFRSWLDLCGYAGDIESYVYDRLVEFVDDPDRNRFITKDGRLFTIEWPDRDGYWDYVDDDELTLTEINLAPIMDVYFGKPCFEIAGSLIESLVEYIEFDEEPTGYETECVHPRIFWVNLYAAAFDDAIEEHRSEFLSDVEGQYFFYDSGYYDQFPYDTQERAAREIIALFDEQGEACFDWEQDDKDWACIALGYDAGNFDSMLEAYLIGVPLEDIVV